MNLDFSEEISTCNDYLLDENLHIGPVKTASELPDHELSRGERRLLGSWCKPDGFCESVYETATWIDMFYREQGRIPADGAELFLWMTPQLRKTDNLNVFLKDNSREEQLSRLALVLNPMTGSIYSGFEEVSGKAKNVCFSVCHDDDLLQKYFPASSTAWRTELLSNNTKRVYIIRAYGDNGELILDKPTISSDETIHQDGNSDNPCNMSNPCHTHNPCNPCSENPCHQ